MKKIRITLLGAVLCLFGLNAFGQGANCASADPFCTGTTYTFNNNSTGTGAGSGPQAQTGPNYGCLLTQPNPAWYYMQILNPGDLHITISQSSGGSGTDVDFICWGPFSSQSGNCGSLTAGNTVDCSYSTSATEVCDITGAVTGQYYLLLLTNYANVPGVITFHQTSGSGTTNCGVLCSQPNAGTAGTQTLTCTTTSVTLNGTSSTPGVTYHWAGPGGFTSNIANPTVSTAGTYTLTVTDPSNPSCPATATQTVTLNNTAPTATAGSTQNITCVTTSANLSASSGTAGATYSWSGPGGFTSSSQNPSATAAGTYTVTVTSPSSGCTATATQTVNSNTTVPNASAGAMQTVNCSVSSVNLSGNSSSPGVTYNWSGPGGFASSTQNPSAANAGTYTVTVTDPANGCTATATQGITSNTTAPDASAGPTQSLTCTVTSVSLSGNSSTSGVTYSWAGPGGYTDGTQSPTVSAAGTYTVTVTDPSNGCTAMAQQTVNPGATAPGVSTGTASSLTCTTSTVNLNGSSTDPNVTYSWSGPGGFTASTTNPSVTAAGTYVLVVTDTTTGCTSTANETVSSNTTAPNVTTGATQSLTCTTLSLNLGGSSTTSGATYNWSGPGGFTAATATPAVSSAGTYTVTVTDPANGCTSTATQLIGSNTTPPAASAGATQTITCATPTVSLSGSSTTSAVTYNWSGPGGFTASVQNPSVIGVGTYTVTVTDPSNGCTATAMQTVNANTTPPNVSTGSAQTITCAVTSVNLSGSSSAPGATYSWSGPAGFSSASANPSVTAAGTYTVTVTDPANGCTGTSVQSVTTNTTPPVAAAGTATSLTCGVTSVALNAAGSSSGSGYTYNWTTSSGTVVSGGSTLTPVVTAGTYTLTVSNSANGCTASGTITVSGVVTPVAAFSASPVTGMQPLPVVFNNNSTDAVGYVWSFGNGTNSTLSDPAMTYNTHGNYTVTLIAVSADGCTDTARTVIHVEEPSALAIPNVFTPNDDGHNDVFKPIQAEGLASFDAAVYDRWGLKMYEWTDYQNNGWSGKSKNGADAPDGTYYYVISGKGMDGKDYNFTGFVSLIRK